MSFKNITVVGLGYIGLPTAAILASKGNHVSGYDIDQKVVNTINKGSIHILEPGLEDLVNEVVRNNFLVADTHLKESDIYIIAVPTPFAKHLSKNTLPEPDLSFIKAATKEISPFLKKGDLIILESTSPVGTTEKIAKWIKDERSDLKLPKNESEESDINIAYCPERVLPGKALKELIENDRVIGGITEKCSNLAKDLYESFVKGACYLTNSRTAEMAKLTENSSRDVQIAFANELSIICNKLDINVWELIELANKHPRVNILNPGPGVGGHCIAVDPWFIVNKNPTESKLIHTARIVNDGKPMWVINNLKILISEYLQINTHISINELVIACYGLSFKANIDDLRESPALEITKKINEFHNGHLIVVEPNIDKIPNALKECKLVDASFALENADIHLLLVDHDEFKKLEAPKNLIDTRGIWSK